MSFFQGYFAKHMGFGIVKCQDESGVSMDDPSFAKINPELNYEDYEPE